VTAPHTAVLVEGNSDRQAVFAAAVAVGRELANEGVTDVSMGGATNIERFVGPHGVGGLDLELVGLCDQQELRFFERFLDRDDIFGCQTDLEDELIRAIGVEDMVRFIDDQGELKPFRTFQKRPAQRDRTLAQHVHRYCGIRAGRTTRLRAWQLQHLLVSEIWATPWQGISPLLVTKCGCSIALQQNPSNGHVTTTARRAPHQQKQLKAQTSLPCA